MTDLDDVTIAKLDEQDIRIIRELEKKLGDDVCLVAVNKKDVIYALEAKMAPNQWCRVDEVYPEVETMRAYYGQFEQAKEAKSALKRLLLNTKFKTREKKRPIRIREIVSRSD